MSTRPFVVLGASGMLGHQVLQLAAHSYDVIGVMRADRTAPAFATLRPYRQIIDGFDMLDHERVLRLLGKLRPGVVVNCVGIVPQHPDAEDEVRMIQMNAMLPRVLERMCTQLDCRLIHISTDCVFSGRGTEMYRETMAPNPTDTYGRSKLLGEPDSPALTLRTSFIGRELRNFGGLLEWFLHQQGAIPGFADVYFSGLTTRALAAHILYCIAKTPELMGLYHVAGPRISKYELLQLCRDVFELEVVVEKDRGPHSDRSLDDTRFRQITGLQRPTWEGMLKDLRDDMPRLR